MPGGPGGAQDAGREALSRAKSFARAHRGRVAGYEAAELSAACAELEQLHEVLTTADAYATFRFDADSEPPAHGALLSELEEIAAAIETETTFFDLEWLTLGDDRADRLLVDPALERYAHLLRVLRLTRPHRLSEAEERVLTEKALTGAGAWRRLFDEQVSALTVELDGDALELPEALALLSSADRTQRRRAADAVTAALAPGLRTRARALNVLVADHALDDRLRAYPSWLAARNLENETSDESVRALADAVEARYDLPQRWARVKAAALGLDRLADYDRSAPVGGPPPAVSWTQARELVIASYTSFSDQLGQHVTRFFDERWIDAEPRSGKTPGAYCAPTTPACHPYVLVNFAGRLDDVLVLAHEIGHGLHYLLAAPRGVLAIHTPVTVAETASVFGETLTFAHLLDQTQDPARRWGLLAAQLDETMATVFRQIAIHRFEDAIHSERREQGELSGHRIGELWLAANQAMFGDTTELSPGYATWWSYVSHVFAAPGYVYAYAYGQLLALSLYARYLDEGEAFVPRYLRLLRAGGSRSPQELAAYAGVDLADPGFWTAGIALIETRLAEAELVGRSVTP